MSILDGDTVPSGTGSKKKQRGGRRSRGRSSPAAVMKTRSAACLCASGSASGSQRPHRMFRLKIYAFPGASPPRVMSRQRGEMSLICRLRQDGSANATGPVGIMLGLMLPFRIHQLMTAVVETGGLHAKIEIILYRRRKSRT